MSYAEIGTMAVLIGGVVVAGLFGVMIINLLRGPGVMNPPYDQHDNYH